MFFTGVCHCVQGERGYTSPPPFSDREVATYPTSIHSYQEGRWLIRSLSPSSHPTLSLKTHRGPSLTLPYPFPSQVSRELSSPQAGRQNHHPPHPTLSSQVGWSPAAICLPKGRVKGQVRKETPPCPITGTGLASSPCPEWSVRKNK